MATESQTSTPIRHPVGVVRTNAYATPAQYRSVKDKKRTTGSDTDGNLMTDLQAESEKIDFECQRVFLPEENAVVTFQKVTKGLKFFIGDWFSVSAVELDGEVIDAIEYSLENEVYVPSNFPFNYIILPKNAQTIKITGGRGWRETPAVINNLVIELTAVRRLQSRRSFESTTERRGIGVSQKAIDSLYQELSMFRMIRSIGEAYS